MKASTAYEQSCWRNTSRLTSYLTQNINATSPDTGFDNGDDAFGEVTPNGIEYSPAYRATLAMAGVSAEAQDKLLPEIYTRDFSLDSNTLEVVQTRLQVLQYQNSRMEDHLEVLILMLKLSGERPHIHVVQFPNMCATCAAS